MNDLIESCPGKVSPLIRGDSGGPTSSHGIMVFAEQERVSTNTGFQPVTYELIGKALELARPEGSDPEPRWEVTVVTVGFGVSQAAKGILDYGVDRVVVYDHPDLRQFVAESYAQMLEDAVRWCRPAVLLIGATPLGRSLAPRVAVRLRTGLTADCTGLTMDRGGILVQTRPAFGGNIMAEIVTREMRPQMATVRHRVMSRAKPVSGPTGGVVAVRNVSDDPSLLSGLKRALGRIRVVSETPLPKAQSITDARVIVACGRGIRSQQDLAIFRRLAQRLGGLLAGTRPLVEKGWIPPSHQVGQSGRTVRPELYIACGISGAIQHIAGMSNSKTIVAINQDRDAPIFEVAHYGIVGDMYEIVPLLLDQIG